MSNISKRAKELKSVGDHEGFLRRIQKTLYYSMLPSTDRLSLPVTEYASEFFSEPRTGRSLDRLHCKDAAHISSQACVSPCSFVLAMLYLERLKVCNPDYLQYVSPSELFLVSLMVSSKFLNDYGEEDEVFMDEWAASGGLSVKELIDLEREFLNAIQWEIYVNESTFWKKLLHLESIIAKKQGVLRGYFTYTELNSLLTPVDASNLFQFLAAVVAVLTATYTAGILTIISSMFIVSHLPGNCLQPSQPANETIIPPSYDFKKPLDAADVLKTGILLASIKSYDSNFSQENAENISWDWWSSSSMNWLAQTSKSIENLELVPILTKYTYDRFIDTTIAGTKKLHLEDHLDLGTKIRLQDRLENSWHKEWTDSIAGLFMYKPLSFFHEIKA